MTFKLLFFAALRDAAQTPERSYSLDLDAPTVSLLLERLSQELPELQRPDVRVAVNHEFVDRSHRLADGDEIAFIPPVAGG